MVLTNDGAWANRVLHPRYGIEREYAVLLDELPTRAEIETLLAGVELDDGPPACWPPVGHAAARGGARSGRARARGCGCASARAASARCGASSPPSATGCCGWCGRGSGRSTLAACAQGSGERCAATEVAGAAGPCDGPRLAAAARRRTCGGDRRAIGSRQEHDRSRARAAHGRHLRRYRADVPGSDPCRARRRRRPRRWRGAGSPRAARPTIEVRRPRRDAARSVRDGAPQRRAM